jgi:hypothetical protein
VNFDVGPLGEQTQDRPSAADLDVVGVGAEAKDP